LWSIVDLRRMIMRSMLETGHTSNGSHEVRAESWLAGRAGGSPLLASIKTTEPLQRWARLFDGLMHRHSVLNNETGRPLTAVSLSLSLGSILFLTFELSRDAARDRYTQVVHHMDGHLINGFTSQLLDVASCESVAQKLVAGIKPPASGCLDKLASSFFEVEHSTSQMVGRIDRNLEHTGRSASSTIIVLSSNEVVWQRAILQQLLLKDGFNVLCSSPAKGVDELLYRRKSKKAVVLWLLSDGFLQDAEAAAAAESVAVYGSSGTKDDVAHVLVHEIDDRKPRFRFDWSHQLAPLAAPLAGWLEAKLSALESVPFERRSFLQRAMLETIEGRLVSLTGKVGAGSSSLDELDMEEAHSRRRRATGLDVFDDGGLGLPGSMRERSVSSAPRPVVAQHQGNRRLASAVSGLLRRRGSATPLPSDVELSGKSLQTTRAGGPLSKLKERLGRKPSNDSFDEAEDSLKALPAPRPANGSINTRPNATAAGISLLNDISPCQSEVGSFKQRDDSEASSSFSRPNKSIDERLVDVLQAGVFPDAPVTGPVSPQQVVRSASRHLESSTMPSCRGRLEVGQSVSTGGTLDDLLRACSEHSVAAAPERGAAQGPSPSLKVSSPSPTMQAEASNTTTETDDLATWLAQRARVGPKFIDAVMAACEEQMISSVDNLATLQESGLLGSCFKPMVAACIEKGLGGGSRGLVFSGESASSGSRVDLVDQTRV